MKKLTIAIDGPSAAGKSTISKLLAKKLNYVYIDTGAMYRCVAYYCLANHIDLDDEEHINEALKNISINLASDNEVYLNGQNVTKDIRKDEVSSSASKVSRFDKVRSFLVHQQREMAKDGGTILDGRDIGTVVLPDADLKIYQEASVETRALRRYKENKERGLEASLDKIKEDIAARDYNDTHRKISPLKKADDAITIDTSNMSIEEVVNKIMALINEKKEG